MGIESRQSRGCAGARRVVAHLAVWHRSLLGAALLALVGCAAAPVPPLPNETPAAWRNAAAAATPAPDLRGWWKAFNDPVLDHLVDAALTGNLSIAQAAQRIEGARTLYEHRYAPFLPQLGAHTLNEPTPDSSASYFQLGFDAKWELGLFGRAANRARVAAGDFGVAQAEAQAARVSVVAEVVRSYLELRGAQERLALMQQLAARAADKVALTGKREHLRLASVTDLARAQAEQASAEAALYEPQLAIETCLQKLAVLVGRSEPDASLAAAGRQPTLGDLGITSAPADLLRTRPEILRAQNEVLKAAGEAGLAHSELFPHIGLGGSLTYSARVLGHGRLSDADSIVTIGPAIDLPLFDWGARVAAADAKNAELTADVLAYRQTVLEGVAEAETAMAALERQRERVAALGRGIASVEQAVASADTLRGLGLSDDFDRIASAGALTQARIEIAQAEQERNIAFVALYKALGGAPLPAAEPAR